MKLFKKPKWLRPEIDEPKYWLHLVIIVLVVYTLVNIIYPDTMKIDVHNVLIGALLVGAGDMVAHTLLRLD